MVALNRLYAVVIQCLPRYLYLDSHETYHVKEQSQLTDSKIH